MAVGDWLTCHRSRPVELASAGFEGADHAPHGLMKQRADGFLQNEGFEFEVDVEIDDAATVILRKEFPAVAHVLERTVGVADINLTFGRQAHF